jgi:hypothetical protein
MPFGERANGDSVESACFLQKLYEPPILPLMAEASLGAHYEGVGGGSSVPHNAVMDSEPAGEHSGARGKAGSIGGEAVREDDALLGYLINIWRSFPPIAITGKMVGAESININVEDTHKKPSLSSNLKLFKF